MSAGVDKTPRGPQIFSKALSMWASRPTIFPVASEPEPDWSADFSLLNELLELLRCRHRTTVGVDDAVSAHDWVTVLESDLAPNHAASMNPTDDNTLATLTHHSADAITREDAQEVEQLPVTILFKGVDHAVVELCNLELMIIFR